jgi:hypothetical protein
MFEAFGIPIYHAWIYSPESDEYKTIEEYGKGSHEGLALYVAKQKSSKKVPNALAAKLAKSTAQNRGFAATMHGLFTLASEIIQDQYSIFYDGTEFVSLLSLLTLSA